MYIYVYMIPGVRISPCISSIFGQDGRRKTPHHTMRKGWNCKVKKRLN
jgi:hypothetical protein